MIFITGENYDSSKHNLSKIKIFRNKYSHKLPEWKVWRAMRGRCHDKTHTAYKRYGGRGIGYCERWLSFDNFYEDMGPRPYLEFELDRIKNHIGYCKDNCRWVSASYNNSNRASIKGSLPRGVSKYSRKEGKYIARIRIEKVRYSLGLFDSLEEARDAHNIIFKEWFGVSCEKRYEK